MSDVTQILQRIDQGDPWAAEKLPRATVVDQQTPGFLRGHAQHPPRTSIRAEVLRWDYKARAVAKSAKP